ncbi:pyocin activator PrtN family protein [Klebsiella aerogenes]|uniref:pyocin activator PrtN family protein n=1 Tax=Klebsiella aerogenes TaxID=548 RepID=UPI00339C21AE
MNTMFLLMAEYETTNILLVNISEKYLGMAPSTANKKAAAGLLPFPVYRIGSTQKAAWVIHVQDLAERIDYRRAAAKAEWQALRK